MLLFKEGVVLKSLALNMLEGGIRAHGTSDTPVERRQERQAHMKVRYFMGTRGLYRALRASGLALELKLDRLIRRETPPQWHFAGRYESSLGSGRSLMDSLARERIMEWGRSKQSG